MSEVAIKRDDSPLATVASNVIDPWLSMIEKVAADPTVDISRIEQLYALKQRSDAAKSERQFAVSMAAAQAEIAPVAKNKANTHTNSRYADLAAIADAVQPIYSKHGFALTFGVEQAKTDAVTVTCEVIHADGHMRKLAITLPLDSAGSGGKVNKTQLQATGSTITYGRRYLTCMAFNVAIADADGNKPPEPPAPVETITAEQAGTLREMVESIDGTTVEFCQHFKIATIGDLPAKRYDFALSEVKKRAANR